MTSSGVKLRNPAQLCSMRVTSIAMASSKWWMPVASTVSSGQASCGSTGSASAGDTISRPVSGRQYQRSSIPEVMGQPLASMPSGNLMSAAERRLGCNPTGLAPAITATRSAQAPAALMMVPQAKSPFGVEITQPPLLFAPSALIPSTGAASSILPPRSLNWRENPCISASTSISDAPGSKAAPIRRSGLKAGTSSLASSGDRLSIPFPSSTMLAILVSSPV